MKIAVVVRTSVPVTISGVKTKTDKTDGEYLASFQAQKGKSYEVIASK